MENEMDEATLTRTLNSLLAGLEVPLVLQSPLELTPAQILLIFESMLRMHLPISPETRKCKTHASRVEAMKIFIGVLEDDVLGLDVGLADVDPRRLAEGRWGELMRVAETLCWLGKRMGYISRDGLSAANVARSRECTFGGDGGEGRHGRHGRGNVEEQDLGSPSIRSALSTQTGHDSSLLTYSTRSLDDSQTTVTTHLASDDHSQDMEGTPGDEDILGEDAFSIIGRLSPLRRDREYFSYSGHTHVHDYDDEDTQTDVHPFRRHDVESDYSEADGSHGDSDLEISESSKMTQPVRTAGYLEVVDLDEELREFELRRKRPARRSSPHVHRLQEESLPSTPSRRASTGIITRHTSPLQYNLALMEERARLLSELARLRHHRS